jgi:hypothetical protein
MLLLSLLACALHEPQVGLVQNTADEVHLIGNNGRDFHVISSEIAGPLRQLEGCSVSVTGRGLRHRLWINDWKVLDAGDGSSPFVGVLRQEGLKYVIRDRNSGSTVYLDPRSMNGLLDHVDDLVLVVGYVQGTHQVSVVSWKALIDEAD